jgi:hypothetical protein
MGAPVCHDSRDQVISQPAPNKLPAIPIATDLPSAIRAIAALKTIVEQITRPTTTRPTPLPGIGTYKQFSQVTEKVKVTNPNDPSQFVEIERIKSLVMKDIKTGEAWTWNR